MENHSTGTTAPDPPFQGGTFGRSPDWVGFRRATARIHHTPEPLNADNHHAPASEENRHRQHGGPLARLAPEGPAHPAAERLFQ